MLAKLAVAALITLPLVFGAPATCSRDLDSGAAVGDAAFWMEDIKHQGVAAYNPDPQKYKVFRNVKVSVSHPQSFLSLTLVGLRGKRRRHHR